MGVRLDLGRAEAEAELIQLLRLAHAGELAAAYAYNGHWRSVRDEAERIEIHRIEREELDHRSCVGAMLASLAATPDRFREARLWLVGKVIGLLCLVGGWFVPMYGAGKLESGNIAEYEAAARLALLAGYPGMVEPLLEMAEIEWDHERYFRDKAASHWLWQVFPHWEMPPARSNIRSCFAIFEAVHGTLHRAAEPVQLYEAA